MIVEVWLPLNFPIGSLINHKRHAPIEAKFPGGKIGCGFFWSFSDDFSRELLHPYLHQHAHQLCGFFSYQRSDRRNSGRYFHRRDCDSIRSASLLADGSRNPICFRPFQNYLYFGVKYKSLLCSVSFPGGFLFFCCGVLCWCFFFFFKLILVVMWCCKSVVTPRLTDLRVGDAKN